MVNALSVDTGLRQKAHKGDDGNQPDFDENSGGSRKVRQIYLRKLRALCHFYYSRTDIDVIIHFWIRFYSMVSVSSPKRLGIFRLFS